LLNHSCFPNALVQVDIDVPILTVTILRDVRKNDELLVSYCPIDSLYAERWFALNGKWNFLCDCKFCNSDRKHYEGEHKTTPSEHDQTLVIIGRGKNGTFDQVMPALNSSRVLILSRRPRPSGRRRRQIWSHFYQTSLSGFMICAPNKTRERCGRKSAEGGRDSASSTVPPGTASSLPTSSWTTDRCPPTRNSLPRHLALFLCRDPPL
jgi:hypothetical protein